MPRPRSESFDLASTALYHCISRCVRRAFLCGRDPYTGNDYEHRKDWVESRLFQLAEIFAIEIYAFAVMSNHLHVVLRINQQLALSWTDDEVIERYGRLFKNAAAKVKELPPTSKREIVATWRSRLYDLSWVMRSLNEHIARRANKEDGCTGRFWEGRFKSQPLLDEAALLTCMAYVDLNHVRAGVVETLDTDIHSSIARRLKQAELAPDCQSPPGLVPFEDQALRDERSVPMQFFDYVELLEWTGRCKRAYGPGGSLRGEPPRLLVERRLDPAAWLETMEQQGLRHIGVLGSVEALDDFAAAHGKRWVRGKSHARKRSL